MADCQTAKDPREMDGKFSTATVITDSQNNLITGEISVDHKMKVSINFQTAQNKKSLDQLPKIYKSQKTFECPLCTKTYTSRSSVKSHLKSHHSDRNPAERSFICEMCEKSFVCKSSLNQHMKLKHLIGDIYKCHFERCPRSFNTKTDLTRHLRTHTGVRPFMCQHCHKTFTCKSSLKVHVRSHEGKKFPCDYCQKQFNILSDKARHESTHTGRKPWSCLKCNKRYSCKSALKVHIKSVHMWLASQSDEPDFDDPPSDAIVVGIGDDIHANIDEYIEYTAQRSPPANLVDSKPWACLKCYNRYSCKAGLKAHIKTVHSGDIEVDKADDQHVSIDDYIEYTAPDSQPDNLVDSNSLNSEIDEHVDIDDYIEYTAQRSSLDNSIGSKSTKLETGDS